MTSPLTRPAVSNHHEGTMDMLLDGAWDAGIDRVYDRQLKVPGLATDPAKPTPGTLWYSRIVQIPAGPWTHATLTLDGARFAPEVYVDGRLVSAAEGGMAPTTHRFALPAQQRFRIEIALMSQAELPLDDASAVPPADVWRANVSSSLWASVHLRLRGDGEILRVLPTTILAADRVALRWDAEAGADDEIDFGILDGDGKVIVQSPALPATPARHTMSMDGRVAPWSPETPNLYRLRTRLIRKGKVLDEIEQAFAARTFTAQDRSFQLNGQPYPVRMGTVVWHRWARDPEAGQIAFDADWFERNVVLRLKAMGANGLRFHLGLPPEPLLDLCDRHGLVVQMEWPFFHGIYASIASMSLQYRAWLDRIVAHPSIVIIQPWNETGGDQLAAGWAALDPLLEVYPPIVVAHRDLTPVHKYWWSLFENLGLYYDSAEQFPQAIMVDEFGGNYMDGNGDSGLYPTTRESILRFLGRDSTRASRLQFHAGANGRVAEYWRRLGAAGISPFAILGSREDGNHWFLGRTDIAEPALKPVWAALAAAFAPVSVSIEIWNRNFAPGETISLPLWFFNDTADDQAISASLHVIDGDSGADAVPALRFDAVLAGHGRQCQEIAVSLPATRGDWRIEARMLSPPRTTGFPVVSAWSIRTFEPQVAAVLRGARIGLEADETELRTMLLAAGLDVVGADDPSATMLVGGASTWARLKDDATRNHYDALRLAGKSVILLDAGPQPLGVGYSAEGLGGPLEGAPSVANPAVLEEAKLFGGVSVAFIETAEPESAIHPALQDDSLWQGLPPEAGQLWNGLRGGLTVPAADMVVSGLSGKAMLAIWEARGAKIERIPQAPYFAYELAGYYGFAETGDDAAIATALRKKVEFLVDDAPALASAINPSAPLAVTNLHAIYRQATGAGEAESLLPLANAGKNLSRSPVVKLTFGAGTGNLIVSQLLTSGRLLQGVAEPGPGVYGRRYDPVAVQFVLNMLAAALSGEGPVQ